jgi:hypothetical protein
LAPSPATRRCGTCKVPRIGGAVGHEARGQVASIRRKLNRVGYYIRNIARDLAPQFLFRNLLPRLLAEADRYDAAYLSQRANYYNKLSHPLRPQEYSANVATLPMDRSMYYYDLKEHARYFPRRFRLNYAFGDVTQVPDRPSFVKSRPIFGDNQNSLLINLDKFRHFNFPGDEMDFRDKKPIAVWRGGLHNPKRVALVSRHFDHPLCDVGSPTGRPFKPFLSARQQMGFRYVISIEGVDVATNLKWVLASNSLCLMPLPNHETWFMEGRLEAGKHYALLRDDFEDLEEKILYYERNFGEALQIIRNANAFAEQFRNAARERLVALLVLYKYFVLTGQLEADDRISGLIALTVGSTS